MRLVFVHGSGGTELVWRYQLERFPHGLAVTLPGRGDGDHFGRIETATEWLRGELHGGAAGPFVLVGHSLGGAIALQYALDHPGELAGIVLVGSGGRLRVHPDMLDALEKALDDPESFGPIMAGTWSKVPGTLAHDIEQLGREFGPGPFLNDLRACDRFDIVERLGEIETPTLAIVGTNDVMTPPKYSTFLRDAMPNATVEIIEGGTHFVFAEQADAVNRAIEAFVAGLAEA